MSILQMSFSAGIMIIVITILRELVINKLPKRTFLILWGVTLCRLLIPFTLESPLSIYSIVSNKSVVDSVNEIKRDIVLMPDTVVSTVDSISTIKSVSIIPLLWLIGFLGLSLFFVIIYIKCRLEFRESIPIKNIFLNDWLSNHPLHRKIVIKQLDKINTPLTFGVFHPVILLPSKISWENEEQLNYALTHEYVHIKRYDILLKLFLILALCIHWFNPFVWIMYMLANQDIEFFCDETVIRRFGETAKSYYALTLIKMEESKNLFTPLCNNFSKNSIEERIVSIMNISRISKLGIAFAAMLVIIISISFATSAVKNSNASAIGSVENNESISYTPEALEQRKNEEIKDKGIKYSIYEKYGLRYNSTEDLFFYNEMKVRYFKDVIDSDGNINGFSYDDGVIDLKAIRNSDNELVRLEVYSQEEFDNRTQQLINNVSELPNESISHESGATNKNMKGTGASEDISNNKSEVSDSETFETGDGSTNMQEDSLKPYTSIGIQYDKDNNVWMYEGKVIYFLYDEYHLTYLNKETSENAISLKIVRDSDGKITAATLMADDELNKILD